jgi:nicotinamide-nucleotide amidase
LAAKIEIIGIGNELIHGSVADQNTIYAAARLSALGFSVTRIVFVGDDLKSIRSALKEAGKRADIVLVSGGLGNTGDDITVEAVGKAFNRPLVLHKGLQEELRRYLDRRDIPWDPVLEKLAWLPQGSEVFHPRPKTCGFMLTEKDRTFFFLPGIPEEMKRVLDRRVIPYLLQHYTERDVIRSRTYRIFGLMETEVEEKLAEEVKAFPTLTLGYYPDFPELLVLASVKAGKTKEADRLLDRFGEKVAEVLGRHVISDNGLTLEEVLGELLLKTKQTLAVAESCTGGLIGHRLTAVPGSSAYFDRSLVVYSNRAKKELLGVPARVLSRYGAVSPQTARYMAEGVQAKSKTDWGLAVTGIAGPGGGTPEKPVGTVWIALAYKGGCFCEPYLFRGNRAQIKIMTAQTALNRVRECLLDDTHLSGR